MKLNNDCARRILLEIEMLPFGETITVAKLQEKMEVYPIEDVLALITLFNREHYLTVIDKVSYDDNDVFRDHKVKCLSERGYKALDIIRDDEVWNTLKDNLPNFNELSIYSIIDIANRYITAKNNKLLGLPDTFNLINPRW